jgi:toxin ParE1/3/4
LPRRDGGFGVLNQLADIRQGLRVVGFERRVKIAFLVDDDRVTILRMFPGGKDWEGLVA